MESSEIDRRKSEQEKSALYINRKRTIDKTACGASENTAIGT